MPLDSPVYFTTRPVAVFFWGPRLRAATPARPSAASATTVLRPKRFGGAGGAAEASTVPYSCIVDLACAREVKLLEQSPKAQELQGFQAVNVLGRAAARLKIERVNNGGAGEGRRAREDS